VTVAFNSLDRSPNGALIRSPLGAFNGRRVSLVNGVFGMVWIDSALEYVVTPGLWDRHLALYQEWLQTYADRTPPIITPRSVIAHYPDEFGGRWPIMPAGRAFPPVFIYWSIGRSPSLANNIDAFLFGLRTNAIPGSVGTMELLTRVILTVSYNTSLSTPDTMEPGFTQFVHWLEALRGEELVPGIRLAADAEIVHSIGEKVLWVLVAIPRP
jgi:hypothetical protein